MNRISERRNSSLSVGTHQPRDHDYAPLCLPLMDFHKRDSKAEAVHGAKLKASSASAATILAVREPILNRALTDLRKTKEDLEKRLKNPFPAEERGLVDRQRAVEEKIRKLNIHLKNAQDAANKPAEEASRLSARGEQRRATFKNILDRYPEAKKIDLACLALKHESTGLPALTLLTTERGSNGYMVALPGYLNDGKPKRTNKYFVQVQAYSDYYRRFDWCENYDTVPGDIQQKIAGLVESATGVELYLTDYKDRNCVTIQTEFSDNLPQIPEGASDIIRHARASKLFEQVYVLTPARKWTFKSWRDYVDWDGCHKEGRDFERRTYTQDPMTPRSLVVGFVKVAGELLPVAIHEFETNPPCNVGTASPSAGGSSKPKVK